MLVLKDLEDMPPKEIKELQLERELKETEVPIIQVQ
jgi:hypothetical protein